MSKDGDDVEEARSERAGRGGGRLQVSGVRGRRRAEPSFAAGWWVPHPGCQRIKSSLSGATGAF